MATLYELTGNYQILLEMASDPDTDPQMIADTMESLDGELEDKADGYAKVIAMLNSDANEIDAEIKRLQARKTALKNNADRMKERLQEAMVLTGRTKFKTALFSFGIQKNPPRVVLDADVPEEYLIPQEPKVDTQGIRAALKAGEKLGYAHLEQSESLRIR